MKQKIAIITGASSGIGLHLSHELVKQGWAVVGVSRRARARSGAARHAQWVDADVGDARAIEHLFEQVKREFDGCDLVVNNAGVFLPKEFSTYSDDDYTQLVETNLHGFFNVTRAALRLMRPQRSGHIVSVTTSLVSQPIQRVPASLPILTKGAIEAATRSLAIENAALGIRVNAVAPGIIDTPMHAPTQHDFLRTLSPAGRMGTVDEVVDAILYLERAAFVSGEVLRVDGGAHAGHWS